MGSDATITTLDPVLKTIYAKRAEVLAWENRPFFALVPKNTDFKGKNYTLAVQYAANQGRSAVFATAQANKNANAFDDFVITRTSDYAVFGITGEALEAAAGDVYTQAEGLQSQIDGAIETISNSLAAALYRSGSGSIGQISAGSVVGTATVTLAQPLDAINFQVGMTLVVSATDGGAARAGNVTVAAVDYEAGTITVNEASWDDAGTGIAAVAAGDYIQVEGDTNAKLKGLAAWMPAAADTLYGVNRAPDRVKLAGVYYSGGGAPKIETLTKVAMRVFHYGGKPTHLFVATDDAFEIATALMSKEVITETVKSGNVTIGFEGFQVRTPSGMVKVIADPFCPKGHAYLLTLSTWELRSLGPVPRFLGQGADNLRVLREATADAYEGRMGYRAALLCRRPKDNAHIVW